MSITSGAWLGVELAESGVRAMLAWPDASGALVPTDGTSGVPPFVEACGWTAARPAPGADGLALGGHLDAAALTEQFRRVVQAAGSMAGGLPSAATVVVPTGWSVRYGPVVRQAAAMAGLGVVEVVPAAVAVGWHLLAGGMWLQPGASVLVCAVDPGCTATVLQRTVDGFAVQSSVESATVAADLLALTAAGGATGAPGQPGSVVPEVVRRAMAGAHRAVGELDVVCVIGTAADATVVQQVAGVCGVAPVRLAQPALAAVLGAVQRGPAVVPPAPPVLRWRDVLAGALPAVWSVVLFAQFLAGSQRYGPREKLEPGMLLAAWGGLAFAATFAVVAAVGGLLLAAGVRLAVDEPRAGVGWVRHRLEALAVAGGAMAGMAVAAGYALLAAGVFDLDLGPLLRWSVLPVVPAALAAAALGVVVWRRPEPPAVAWLSWMRFPPAVSMLAGFGALLISFDETGSPWLLNPLAWQLEQWMPSGRMTIIGPVGRLGGVCVGAAVAWLLLRRPLWRVLLGTPLALLVGASLAWRVTSAVAVGFALVVAGWWAGRTVWLVLRPLAQRSPSTAGALPAGPAPWPTGGFAMMPPQAAPGGQGTPYGGQAPPGVPPGPAGGWAGDGVGGR